MSNYKLYQGDCLEIMENIDDNSVDLIITDPPYQIETVGGGIIKKEHKEYVKEISTMNSSFSSKVLDEMCRIMKKINIYIFCSQKQIIPLLDYFVKNKKCNWNILSWHKTNPIPTCNNKYLTDTEFVLFFREKGVRIYGSFETKKTWYATPINKTDKKMYNHPTVKPENIIYNFIINSSKESDVIFDPFMGSGTTGKMALLNNRNFIGVEIDESYFNTAKERIENVNKK